MRPTVFLVLLALVPGFAVAQGVGPPPPGGPRGYYMVDLSDGEPISGFIEASRRLGLSEAQKKRLMDIRRALRDQNRPHMVRLDSLRALAGLELGATDRIRRRDREALERFTAWSRPVVDSIRVNNDVARSEARGVLTIVQRQRFDSLAAAARTPARGNPRRPIP